MFKKLGSYSPDEEKASASPGEFVSNPRPYTPPVQEERPMLSAPSIEVPETILGEQVSVKGELQFDELLRIDGTFEGSLHSNGKLIIGPKGLVKADISLQEAYISGRVEGDITVSGRLILRGEAEIYGNITARFLSVDEGVTIVGQVNVSPTGKETATDSYEDTYDYNNEEPF